jgi:hypothetical protein
MPKRHGIGNNASAVDSVCRLPDQRLSARQPFFVGNVGNEYWPPLVVLRILGPTVHENAATTSGGT